LIARLGWLMVLAMPSPYRRIAILGGGPAGATAAATLARAGTEVVLFARSKRPPIIVGESLVPAVVPYLRRLGIEEEVASYSTWKGGATFIHDLEYTQSFRFNEVRGAKTTYSYNVPRDRFDASVLESARRAGARVIDHAARVEREPGTQRVLLSEESLTASGFDSQPDFIIDAGGRSRQFARLFDIETIDGDRRDTALHAHFEGVEVEIEGNVHTDRLEHGWSWRIPLPGRVSIGVVIDSEYIRKFGDSPEDQLDSFLKHDPVIRDFARPATRITPVLKYTNYQSRVTRGVGENWAMLGDAYGFIDPVFSSGVLIAFEGGERIARALTAGTREALESYDTETQRSLAAWQRVIRWYYDGRLLTLFKVGNYVERTLIGKLMSFHFRKHMPRIFTGEDATNRYSLGLIDFMVKYALAGNDPAKMQIN
jgi:flavin-dependent dehydrogenase